MDEDGWISLPISGREVRLVAVSRWVPFLRLHFWGMHPDPGPDYTLEIEGPFRLETFGSERLIDPASGPDQAYLRFVDKTVEQAIATRDGGLRLEFGDGDRLIIPPHRFEPWQLNGDDGYLVVSVAGGGLSMWSGNDSR